MNKEIFRIMKRPITFFFLLLFSFFILIPAVADLKGGQKKAFQSFYSSRAVFPLKEIGLLKKDSPYYISPLNSRISLITSKEFTVFLKEWSNYRKIIDQQLLRIFEINPYFKKSYLFFSSPRRQTSNALAAVLPFPFVRIYPSGSPATSDLLSLFSWTQDTLLHEMTHIYQLSQNSKWDRILRPILGLFSHRNALLPSWILEGDAVFTESLYGSGGRLYSGFVRAFVFSQFKEDFPLQRLLKSYNESFSGSEKYLHGAYFFSYLHSQYGLKRIKRFFHETSRFIPLDYYGLNQALKRTFEKDLLSLFKAYKAYYRGLAQHQKTSSAPVLAKSQAYVPLNSDKKSIYFLISDSKSPSELIVFDKKTAVVKRTKKNLPLGKVFYKQGEYLSSANITTSSTSYEYSLVKEDFKPISKYNSQIVMDFYKGKAISIDARQAHIGNSLIIDRAFYGTVDSSVLADSKGGLYYFKQEGEYRTLYKNKQALYRFKSYFSYPVEVKEDEVYFIGAVKYGSSLFVYKKGLGVYRLSESDAVVSARQIQGNRFLISEIRPSHYEYKIIEAKKRAEEPVLYQYSFQKENIFLKSEKQKNQDQKEESLVGDSLKNHNFLDPNRIEKNFKPYSPFSRLSLDQFFFFYTPEIEEIPQDFFAYFQFLDPLQYNSLLINNSLSEKNKAISLSYSYQKYRPSLELSFLYEESSLDLKKDKYQIKTWNEIDFLDKKEIFYPVGKFLRKRSTLFQRTRELSFILSYPISIGSESELKLRSQWGLGEMEFNKNRTWKNYIVHSGQLSYQFKRRYPLAYSYHKKRQLSFLYKAFHFKGETQIQRSLLEGAVYADFVEELSQEYFLSLNGKLLLNLWDRKPYQFKNFAGSVTYPEFKQAVQNLYQGNLKLLKALNYSYYPLKWPFSLRRTAPLIGLSVLTAQDFSSAYRSFIVPFAGLEGELNILHEKWIVKLGLSVENRIELFKPYKKSKLQFSFWMKSSL